MSTTRLAVFAVHTLVVAVSLLAGLVAQAVGTDDACTPIKKAELLVQLPELCPTPDGMAMDSAGNIILACPNYADQTHPAVLLKIDPKNQVRLFCQVPPHPETGVACPMGLEFSPEGDLYLCDNQGWAKPNDKGQILRAKMTNGRPVAWQVVASGMSHPNGVRIRNGYLYVTQSLLPKIGENPLVSGVYRFKLDDKNVKVTNTAKDKNLFVTFKTLNPKCQYGVDGIVFDSKGNLFVGNFGDATIHKVTFDAAGNVASNTIFAKDACMRSTDGMCVDKDDNLYVADFSGNAVCLVSPEGKVRVLAKNGDTDGADGSLDEPGEPIVRGREVVVSNFDLVTGPDKVNTKHDWPYTISVIRLDKKP